MKAKNLVLFCALSLIISYCGPQQPKKTTSGGGIIFPTSTTPTSTPSTTPSTTTTTQPPTTTTTQPITPGYITSKTGIPVSSSDPCLQAAQSPTSGVKVFNVILDVQSTTNMSNLGLEVYICNAYAGSVQNVNSITQFLALSKSQSGATTPTFSLLDMAPDIATTLNEYGFFPNRLEDNWRSTQGRYDQAMAIKAATEERYKFKCGFTEKYIMQRGGYLPTLLTFSSYQVIMILYRTFDGYPLDAKKWDKVNRFNDEVNITIPCPKFD